MSPKNSGDPLGREAGNVAGTYSILTGIAANASIAERRIVRICDFELAEYLR